MFENLFRKKPPPLSGKPLVRREKVYAAHSGYVYSYFHLGYRDDDAGVEYLFEVSAGRE